MPTLRQQTAVIVAGPPGAGKSKLAEVVARELPAVLIDIDVTVGTIDPRLTGEARRVARAAAYGALADAAVAAAQSSAHVVVAAPFTQERRDPRAWTRLCERFAGAGAEAVLAWIRVPDACLLERLATRSADRDATKLADPGGWLREADPGTAPSVPHVEVDGTCSADAAARALLAALAAREGMAPRRAQESPARCAN
jgi:predicted kinase